MSIATSTHSTWFFSLPNAKPIKYSLKWDPQTPLNSPSFKTSKIPSFPLRSLSDEASSPTSSDTPYVSEEPDPDRVKLAFDKARDYSKSFKFDQVSVFESPEDGGLEKGYEGFEMEMASVEEFQMMGNDGGSEENDNLTGDGEGETVVPEAFRIAMEKAKDYQKNKGNNGISASDVDSIVIPVDGDDEKDKEYKESKDNVSDSGANKEENIPEALRVAMEKAREYKKNKVASDNNSNNTAGVKFPEGSGGSLGNGNSKNNTGKSEELKISSIDFIGLNFADKKEGRGLPAGLVPVSDPFLDGDLPEVEILVGDASKFENTVPLETKQFLEDDSGDLYKPKVSTWGMFPRPSNISKTFGGGRTIRPGQALETPEQKAAKEARTRQLLADYKSKFGLNMDPKLRVECEKALKDGDSLMDAGRLKEALPYYQQVMDKLSFQTELHGLAALQWSICQDSLSRPEKARVMYEKLQSHPNGQVNKKARQFMFSFQAMEMMKVTRSSTPRNTDYQKYFEAFVDDKETYTSEDGADKEDGALIQVLPYIVFLASPILIIILVAATKGV